MVQLIQPTFHSDTFYATEIDGNLFVYIDDFTFDIWHSRTSSALRHRNTRKLPLKPRLNLHQVGDPTEKHVNQLQHI